jgi:endo-1,4-beta-D-glucanase Y
LQPALIAVAVGILSFGGASSAADTASRPFPFHTVLTHVLIKPNNVTQAAMDAKIRSFYGVWKTAYLRKAGGEYWVKYDATNSTVSEAHGYGMVLAAYLGDKAIFDSMFRYFKKHPSVNAAHLMAWKQTLRSARMVNVEGGDSATDGDMDVAYALLLANVQWGSQGAINYKLEAVRILRDILAHEVNTTTWTLTPGDWASGADANHTRPSDFMTGHFIAFAKADPANAVKWNRISPRFPGWWELPVQSAGSQNTGLMPDFLVRSGAISCRCRGCWVSERRRFPLTTPAARPGGSR